MKAVVLVGGKGTRLRPLTCNRPKPIVPVLNRPLLQHTLRYLGGHGIETVVLAMNYMPDEVRETMGDGSRFGVKLEYVIEREPMGTSGGVRNAEHFLDEAFYVLNGDILTRIDLTEMMRRHRRARPAVSIALVPVEDPTIYGVAETDRTGMVTRFVEKPRRDQATSNLINAGIYIMEPRVLKYIPKGTASMFEDLVFPGLLEAKEPVLGYPSDAYWIDIGTPEKYLKLNHDLIKERGNQVFLEGESHIAPGARLVPPVLIGPGCTIGNGANINGPVVIGPGCHVAENATLAGSVLWDKVSVGHGTTLKSSLAASNCRIAEDCYLEDCVLGEGVMVERSNREWGARIPSACIVPRRDNQALT